MNMRGVYINEKFNYDIIIVRVLYPTYRDNNSKIICERRSTYTVVSITETPHSVKVR